MLEPQPQPLRVRLSDVLFRTRGRDWDYAFLLQPDPLIGEGWYALHRGIFANVEPSARPWLERGSLKVGLGYPYLATTFTDPERRDHQGRPVAHYLVWLDGGGSGAPSPQGFGPALVSALGPALDAVFELTPQSFEQRGTTALDTLLRRAFRSALGVTELQLAP
jgi:hypothetical protein